MSLFLSGMHAKGILSRIEFGIFPWFLINDNLKKRFVGV